MCFMPLQRRVYFMMLMKMQDSRSVQVLYGRKTALFSPELTGSISMNRLSGAGEKTESISGMVTRNRKRIKNSKEDGCGHPSSKPVPLIAYLISQCTQTNGMVLDGFLGSASTLIACEQLNRVCFGVELEPKFVDVAVERYIKLHAGNSDDVYLIRNGERIDYKDVTVSDE